MKNSTFLYTYCALSLKKFFQKNSNLHVVHVHPCAFMCTHVWIMNELKFNWKWTQLRTNLNLIKSESRTNWKWSKN
jgi:hypothetical protein